MVGMCTMGYVGDLVGRNKAFAITSMIMVLSSVGSAVFPFGGASQAYAIIGACRFFLGVGIGGCYPLSAAKSAEESGCADVLARNQRAGAAFVFQAIAAIIPYLVGMIVYTAGIEFQFRFLFALGAVPPAIVLWCTWGARESEEWTSKTTKPPTAKEQLLLGFEDPNAWKNLAATGLCWFLYDIAYYGSNQWTPKMTEKIFVGSDLLSTTWHTAAGFSIGLPSVMHALWVLKKIGTKSLQVWGFVLIATSCLLIAAFWEMLTGEHSTPLQNNLLFVLYIFFLFTVNWGPNMSTFVLPQELFPVEIRTTMNGIAAGMGKLGAVAGIWLFDKGSELCGVVTLMLIVAALNLFGAVVSYYCIDDSLWKKQKAQMDEACEDSMASSVA
ncbi:hypothetical protein CYMTET_10579 [Cymbomonas tetramitiformis]|uniref:Major facilitator superfamily (MFS) profile domain-containing protein n=1 Tax=Cymbomonas tetramitiformis TaxID=36881 RepID=A0AAE0GP42_9CHLO|nr:hypothetical protein CYMTET_10579 [Cymbomonas tetramitiformis]